MARPFWKLKTASDIITAMYAMLTSGYWNRRELNAWVDRVIESVDIPQSWIVEIGESAPQGADNLEGVFQHLFIDNAVVLTDEFYEFCVGLFMEMYRQGRATEEETRDFIADMADPGGVSGIQIEMVATIDLNDKRLLQLRNRSRRLIDDLKSDGFHSRHSDLVSFSGP